MKARDQAEQANPHQHVHPAGVSADHGFHRLWQRIVDVRQLPPVADAARHYHHADGQEYQGQNAADIGLGDCTFRVFGFFSGHGRAFDGEEKPDGKGNGGEDAGYRRNGERVGAGPAVEREVTETEARRNHAHEHQQLGNRQNSHHQFKGGRDADTEDIQGHEHEIGANHRVFRVQFRELHVQVSADRHGNGGWGEDELDQRGDPGNQPGFFTEGPSTVGKGAASVRNSGGQFGEAEDKTGIHRCHDQRGDQEAQRARRAPAVTPAKVFAGDHQANSDAP